MKQKPRNMSRTSRTPRPAGAKRPTGAAAAGPPARPGHPVGPAPTPAPAVVRVPQPKEREDFSVTSCGCDDCRAACLNAPGWFMPDQIPRLARHLGLTVEETFRKYLAIGVTRLADGTERAGVMPHKLRDGKKPGSRWTLAEIAQPGRCIFFDRGKCTIYEVRPYECARMMHDRGDQTIRLRKRIIPKWTEAAVAKFLKLVQTAAAGRGGRR